MRGRYHFFLASILILIFLVPTVLAWELDRPRADVLFYNERLEGANTDGKASIGLGVDVFKYYEDDPGYPAYDNEYVKLRGCCDWEF